MCTGELPGTHPAGAQRCKRTGPESCGAAFRDEQGHRNKNESKEESGEPQRVETGHDLMSSWEFHPETLKFVFRITQDLKPKIAPHERKDQQRTARVKQHLVHDHHLEPQPVTWRLWGVTPYHSRATEKRGSKNRRNNGRTTGPQQPEDDSVDGTSCCCGLGCRPDELRDGQRRQK